MRLTFKRLLYLAHRWLGIVLCGFFAMWFISGIVMMYVGYPKLTEAERLAHLPPLAAGERLLSPQQALAAAGVDGAMKELRLSNASAGRPVYFALPAGQGMGKGQGGGRKRASGDGAIGIDAASGQRLPATDRMRALASAAAYAAPGTGMQYLGAVDEDAFSHSRSLDAHRPLHLVQLDDADATLLYISGRTAEVVRDATRAERLWNYVGAWIHWLYPFRGGVFDAYWTDIVNWLSIAGIALAVTGTVVGILRWQFSRPYRSGTRTPYQGFMRWHHIGGLLFAACTLTWIFSGLMSMNPWRVFDVGAAPLRTAAYEGGTLVFSAQDATSAALIAAAGDGVRELRWTMAPGASIVQAKRAGASADVMDSRTGRPWRPDESALRAAAAKLLPYPVKRVEILRDYDLFYFTRAPHTMSGGAEKPLPVWRVVFGDEQESWVHIDPATGTVLGRTDSGKRTSRWLFGMLHSWDWIPLLDRRPLWDVLLIFLSLGGVLMSVSGVVIGWRRLGMKIRGSYASRRIDTVPAAAPRR